MQCGRGRAARAHTAHNKKCLPASMRGGFFYLSISSRGFLTRVIGRFQAFAHLVKGCGVDLAACIAPAQDLHCRWLLRLRPEMLWPRTGGSRSKTRRRWWEARLLIIITASPMSSPCQQTDEQCDNQSYDHKREQAAHQNTYPPHTNIRTMKHD